MYIHVHVGAVYACFHVYFIIIVMQDNGLPFIR